MAIWSCFSRAGEKRACPSAAFVLFLVSFKLSDKFAFFLPAAQSAVLLLRWSSLRCLPLSIPLSLVPQWCLGHRSHCRTQAAKGCRCRVTLIIPFAAFFCLFFLAVSKSPFSWWHDAAFGGCASVLSRFLGFFHLEESPLFPMDPTAPVALQKHPTPPVRSGDLLSFG